LWATLRFAIMSAIVRDEPAPLGASVALDNIVKRCLAKQAPQRFQTIAEVKKALEQIPPKPTERIAETLGVLNVLEGSVRKAGNRLRVTAQLIAASDGSHLWSERFDREMADVFAIQDEIAQAIARALRGQAGRIT
jgi:TolB-like protein